MLHLGPGVIHKVKDEGIQGIVNRASNILAPKLSGGFLVESNESVCFTTFQLLGQLDLLLWDVGKSGRKA